MSVQRFKSLLFKSTKLQLEIEKEQRRAMPDWMRLLKLKKLRLVMKDKLRSFAEQGVQHMPSQSQMQMQPVVVRVDRRTKS